MDPAEVKFSAQLAANMNLPRKDADLLVKLRKLAIKRDLQKAFEKRLKQKKASWTKSDYQHMKDRFSDQCDAFIFNEREYLVQMAKDQMIDWTGVQKENTFDDIVFKVLANNYIKTVNVNMSLQAIKEIAIKELKAERPAPQCTISRLDNLQALTKRLHETAMPLPSGIYPVQTEAFLVHDNTQLFGYAVVRNHMLKHIYVDPKHRKRGYGQTLLAHIKRVRDDLLFVECMTDESISYFQKCAQRTYVQFQL